MKAQISRSTNVPANRYGSVLLQQGRMVTDADWNESSQRSRDHVIETGSDTIGSGVPAHGGVLHFSGGDPTLSWGVLYVDGIRAVVTSTDPAAREFDYGTQSDLLVARGSQLADAGPVYVDVWDRVVTSVEVARLTDPAWLGADTSFRTLVTAQVKQADRRQDPGDPDVNPPIGNARLAARLRDSVDSADPCDPCADEVAVDADPGSTLFRIEIHHVDDPADPASVTLKWSRENGAEQYRADAPLPDWFTAGDHWFEFFNRQIEQNMGVFLAPPAGWDLAPAPLVKAPNPAPTVTSAGAWTGIRRWDGYARLTRNANQWTVAEAHEGAVDLTAGGNPASVSGNVVTLPLTSLKLSLTLSGPANAPLKALRGDAWLVEIRGSEPAPASAADPDPRCVVESETPSGIRHHYLTLGTYDREFRVVHLVDDGQRRELSFPPLTNLDAGHVSYTPDCEDGPIPLDTQTVQAALDALCDLDAAKVRYEPDCEVLSDATTVQQALDTLCKNLDTRVDDRTPRLKLFGRGVLCGLLPDASVAEDPRSQVMAAVLDIVKATPDEVVLAAADSPQGEAVQPSDKRVRLLTSLQAAGDQLGDERIRREISNIQPEIAQDALYGKLRDVVDGLSIADPGRRENVAVTFRTTGGAVIDGKGGYWDLGPLSLTSMVGSWSVSLDVGPSAAGRFAGRLHQIAQSPEIAALKPETVESDLLGRITDLVTAASTVDAGTETDLRAAVEGVGTWRSSTLRTAVSDAAAETAAPRRSPSAVQGWLYLTFPNGQPALAFREDAPTGQVPAPSLLRPASKVITGSDSDIHQFVQDVTHAIADQAVVDAANLPRPADIVAQATDSSGKVTMDALRETIADALANPVVGTPVARADTATFFNRYVAAVGGGSPTVMPLAGQVLTAGVAGPATVAAQGRADIAATAQAATLADAKAVSAADATAAPIEIAAQVAPAADLHDVPLADAKAGALADAQAVTAVDAQAATAAAPAAWTVPEGNTVLLPISHDVIQIGPQVDSVAEQVDAAWAPFAEIQCPQPNDGSVCLGRVGIYGNRVIIVPDDREQLLETPALVNASYWAANSTPVFDHVWQGIVG